MVLPEGVRTASWSRLTKRRGLPRVAVAATHLLLAFALLFGLVQSGGRYFYCEALGLLPSDPCAEAWGKAHSAGAESMFSEHHADCCEIVTLEAMPQAAQATAPGVPPAPCVAILPTLSCAPGTDSPLPSSRVAQAFERWRPPPRAPNDVRAQLMVFLI
jgi:hypothetical protein